MKKIVKNMIKILPIVLLIAVLVVPDSAYAGLENVAKRIIGIRTEECQLDTPDKCLFCPLFEILFKAGSAVADASYRVFHSDLGKLILIFLAVTLALIILKNLASFGAKEAGTLLNELFYRAFVCVAVYIIVTQDYNNILNMTIVPILKDGLNFVGLGNGVGSPKCAVGNISGFSANFGAGEGGLPREVGEMIVGAICNIEQKIDTLFAYGDWAFCQGTGPDTIFVVIPNPVHIIDAVLFYIGGVFFLVAYPWIMADAVLQLGIAMALLPFAVAGYAFSGTRTYLPKTFGWILHSLFVFIFMSILMTCILGYIGQLLDLVFSQSGSAKIFFTDPNRGVAFWGVNMIKIIFILVIGWVYMPEMKDLAGQFAEGSKLSAASKVGTKLTEPMEKQAEKVLNKATDVAAGATVNVAHGLWRRTGTVGRQSMMGFTATFGHTDANGNKTFVVGRRKDGTMTAWGRFWGNRQYTVEKDADGKKRFRTEHTGWLSGRRYVKVSDKYSTVRQQYTASGRQVRTKVDFKHRFLNKYMMNQDGTMNTDVVRTLLNSNMAQNPEYKKAIMEQLAVEVLKKRGFRVSNYYRARNVTFDPNDPTKIMVEQIDHSGKTTKFQMDINMETGQVFTGFLQDQTKTETLHKTERKARIGLHNFLFKSVVPGHYTAEGNLAFDTWFGTHYEMKHDPVLGDVYERTRRKYWLFGGYETKTFGANGTERRTIKSPQATADILKEQEKIRNKLNGDSIAKDWRYTYEMQTDASGNPVYTKRLRSGWNIKNYFRVGTNTVGYVGKNVFKRLPKAAVKVTSGVITGVAPAVAVGAVAAAAIPAVSFLPVAGAALVLFNPKKTWNLFRHPANTFSSMGSSVASLGSFLKRDFKESFDDTWQTGDIKSYSDSGKQTLNSATGDVVKDNSFDKTTFERLDGFKQTTDNITGETTETSRTKRTMRTAHFSNGVLTIDTRADISGDGTLENEITKFKYSDAAKEGHDTLLADFDGNQVVESDGSIAANLWHTLANGAVNPNDLLFGFDNLLGKTAINGQSASDFIVNNILAEGRRRRTNKYYTNILSMALGSSFITDVIADGTDDEEAGDDTPDMDDDDTFDEDIDEEETEEEDGDEEPEEENEPEDEPEDEPDDTE